MYLHTTLYERAPHFWIFIGVLLVIIGIYLGFEVSSTFLFTGVALGLASCAWGIRILTRRARQSGDENIATSTVSGD